jgi:pSer/pThr/pTyr-binding forkhead associated (FHA) protein
VLGRGSQCDILVLDPAVSLVHALIRYEEGGYILYDLGSFTGTLMNGKLVGSLGEPLARGTLIQIGDTVFEFGMIPGTAPQKAA